MRTVPKGRLGCLRLRPRLVSFPVAVRPQAPKTFVRWLELEARLTPAPRRIVVTQPQKVQTSRVMVDHVVVAVPVLVHIVKERVTKMILRSQKQFAGLPATILVAFGEAQLDE